MIYVYLHGFNSAYDPLSTKVQALSTLGEVIGITYNTFGTYDEIFSEIESQVPNEEVVFVGTSLGGFWAAEMAKHFGMPSVIINPCLDPNTALRKYIDEPHLNYVTGDCMTLTEAAVNSYQTEVSSDTAFLPLVLLDMGDEVIDSFETREALYGFPMVHYAGGSHRFEHMEDALEDISEYVNHCSNAGLSD